MLRMSTLAGDFFGEREIVPPSAVALVDAAASGLLKAIPAWLGPGCRALPGRPPQRLRAFYRGQSDASWGLSSGLYRVARGVGNGPVTEDLLSTTEQAILKAMRSEGLGHRMSDGELLTVLQHHAIPTRLIDVSRSALPALYFATETADRIDGRLFIVGLRIDPASGGYPTIQLAGGRGLPWRGAAVGLKYSSYEWTLLGRRHDQTLPGGEPDSRRPLAAGRDLAGAFDPPSLLSDETSHEADFGTLAGHWVDRSYPC
jgi:hypothetical protein